MEFLRGLIRRVKIRGAESAEAPGFMGEVEFGYIAQVGDDLGHARGLGAAFDDFADGMHEVGGEADGAGEIGEGFDGVGHGIVEGDDGDEMVCVGGALVEEVGFDEARLDFGVGADSGDHFAEGLRVATFGFPAQEARDHRGRDAEALCQDLRVHMEPPGLFIMDEAGEIFAKIAGLERFHCRGKGA